jgi:hypothetical protein
VVITIPIRHFITFPLLRAHNIMQPITSATLAVLVLSGDNRWSLTNDQSAAEPTNNDDEAMTTKQTTH